MAAADAVLSDNVPAEELVSAPTSSTWYKFWSSTPVEDHLDASERRILANVCTPFVQDLVPIWIKGEKHLINTIQTINRLEPDTYTADYPLVLLHGFGGGLGMFVKNIDPLAARFKVVAFDCLGFGKSSRPHFPTDPQQTEDMFIDSIEAWRVAMRFEKIVLLGHSFGGYLSAAYALRFPQHIEHLILADPWGFQVRPPNPGARFPLWARFIIGSLRRVSPLSIMRAVGSWGPRLLARVRPDFGRKFQDVLTDPAAIYQYIFYLNALPPSAELGFGHLTHPFGYAKMPMIERIPHLDPSMPVTFIYGRESWMDHTMGEKAKALRDLVDVHVIPGSGHHVYCDQAHTFNSIVADIADRLSKRQSLDDDPSSTAAAAPPSVEAPAATVASPSDSDGHGDDELAGSSRKEARYSPSLLSAADLVSPSASQLPAAEPAARSPSRSPLESFV